MQSLSQQTLAHACMTDFDQPGKSLESSGIILYFTAQWPAQELVWSKPVMKSCVRNDPRGVDVRFGGGGGSHFDGLKYLYASMPRIALFCVRLHFYRNGRLLPGWPPVNRSPFKVQDTSLDTRGRGQRISFNASNPSTLSTFPSVASSHQRYFESVFERSVGHFQLWISL